MTSLVLCSALRCHAEARYLLDSCRPIPFETLSDFCQRPDVGVGVYSLPSRHPVHKTVILILLADGYFEFSLLWTLRMVPFHGLSFCLHIKMIGSGFICCNNSG